MAQTRVERSVYKDAYGYKVAGRAGKLARWKRFPADTPLKKLRAWRDGTASELREDAQPTTDTKTLAGAVAFYLTKTKLPKDDAHRPSFNAWIALYGPLERRKLTPALCQQAFDRWANAGLSPQSLFYRRAALVKLWKGLDGPTVKTPVDAIHIKRPKGKRPVWVPDETIRTVMRTLKQQEKVLRLHDAKTRARFWVLATTGQRPAQLKRTQPADVDLVTGIWWVTAAKGGEPVPVYLNANMRNAWRIFAAADAWGHYDTRSFARTLRSNGWPAGIRPYNLRHATGLTLSANGADLGDIQVHMGHTSMTTTRQYYVPGLHARMQAVSVSLEGRFQKASVAGQRDSPKTA